MSISGDASDFYRLSADLSRIPAKAVGPLRQVMSDVGNELVREWADNARATSGTHGKHYPDSITGELAFSVRSIDFEAGPDSSRKQGVMGRGFEFGSKNQPPHLDGLRALETVAPRVERAIDSAVGFLFG